MATYERPYTARQMLDNGYPPALVRKLMMDPAHAWRARTGIELIHKEPDLKEAIRVWVNWNRMSKRDKARSDRKSKKLFGVDNKTHYEQLRPTYDEGQSKAASAKSDFAEVVKAYKDRYGMDLSHMRMQLTTHPRYTNGKWNRNMPDDVSGGSWGKNSVVYINRNPGSVVRRWGLDMSPADFRRLIIAHELAHELFNKPTDASRRLIRRMLRRAKREKFTTVYLDSYGPDTEKRRLRNETFAEYMAAQLSKKAAVPQALTPPPTSYKPPAGVPAPKAPQPVQASVPQMGIRTVGYGNGAVTGTAGAFEAQRMRGADAGAFTAPQSKSRVIPDAAAMRTARNAESAGMHAIRGLNYLASNPEFQRRVGNGDLDTGRASVAAATRNLVSVPVVNETPRSGAAMAYTRGGDRSYVAMPAATVTRRGAYRGTGEWRNGIMSHELSHPFTNKVRGYVNKIKRIQQEEGVQDTDQYFRTPREQAAEFNALRIMKGAWPGGGAGPGGAYTPEQADSILDNGNPYFRGLPANYKMRLLNEARNRRPTQYGVPRRAIV